MHTQFIHLLEANQCDSVDLEQNSLTHSIKADRVVIQAYIKPAEKLLWKILAGIQIYLHSWKRPIDYILSAHQKKMLVLIMWKKKKKTGAHFPKLTRE